MSLLSRFNFTIPVRRRTLSWTLPEGGGAGKRGVGQRGGRFQIKSQAFTIGRQPPNDLIIEHDTISRRHARVSLEDDTLFVEDMASTRGTWVGSERLKPYARTLIPPDTSLWIGQVELKFERVDAVRIPILPFVFALLFLCCCGVPLGLYINRPAESVSLACNVNDSYLIALPEAKPTEVAVAPIEATPTIEVSPTITTTPALTPTEEAPLAGLTLYNPETDSYNSLNFLDLPIPYSGDKNMPGGSQEQFETASQSSNVGGFINSFFDHYLPIYPPSRGGDEEEAISKNLLLFNGQLVQDLDSWGSGYWYSGHPGYDFAGNSETPIFAAANGFLDYVGEDNCIAQTGYQVKIVHTVNDVGDFQTVYMHLQDDDVFQKLRAAYEESAEDLFIAAGTRIGTMGETGCADGVHLHFEVRFDRDGIDKNGEGNRFNAREVVDPYGYIPSLEFPKDEWPIVSRYLWKYSLGTIQTPTQGSSPGDGNNGVGGAMMQTTQTRPELCAPHLSIPQNGTVYFSLSLSPPGAEGLVSVAKAITFVVLDAKQDVISPFEEKILITLPYSDADLQSVVTGTLEIRRLNTEINKWESITPLFDYENQIAGAEVSQPGQYALFGKPIKDQIPPHTTITATGLRGPDGETWCDAVTVSFTSEDDRSPIAFIDFSLDGGIHGNPTEAPTFPIIRTINYEGRPSPVSETAGDSYPSGDGRFLVTASSTDSETNEEYPPASLYIVIDTTIPRSQCQEDTDVSVILQEEDSVPISPVFYLIPFALISVLMWLFIRRRLKQK